MTLYEYIEKREQVLDEQLGKIMERDDINILAVSIIHSAMEELEKLKTAAEDGLID